MAQKQNRLFYKESICRFGISAQGVHWNSQSSQYKRFEILSEFIKDDIPNASIVDVGCGMGEYYNYLMDENLEPKKYIGIDCEEDMINISKKRYPKTNFLIQNVLEDELLCADYYVCSGAMNILDYNEFFMFILNCYEKCEKGFIFNFLKNDSYNNVKKEEVINFCKKFAKNIQTKDDYLDNDFSIFISK